MNQPIFTRRQAVGGATGLLGLTLAGGLGGCARTAAPGEFVVATHQAPPEIDYSIAGGAANMAKPLFENVVEPLLGRDLDGKIVPLLGEYRLSPDLKIAHFTLRQGVRFHDGSPFTAEDVRFSHERMTRTSPNYKARTRSLNKVEILDDHRVDLHFKENALSFVRSSFLYIYSKQHFDRLGEERGSKELIGTGPYRVKEFRRHQYLLLDANPDYWGPRPQIQKARLVFAPEDMTRVSMLRSGEADLITAVPFSMVPTLRQAGYGHVGVDMHPTFSLRFQLANPDTPWADIRVRRAIAHAVDSNAIISGLFSGIPRRYAGFAPGEPGFDPDLQPYPYNPELSRQMLAEAGYPNGFRMPLVYWTGGWSGLRETTEAVVLYLRAVGIECEVAGIDAAQGLRMNREVAKDPRARLVTVAPAILASYSEPAEALRQGYSSESTASWYHNPDFDRLVVRARTEPDPVKFDRILRAAARKLHQDLPIIPLWNNVAVYMNRPGVHFQPKARDIPGMHLANVRLT